MKKFFDNKDEKITERAFKQGMLISALGILLCIVALCSVTFAWFNVDVSSNSNNIQSSNCVVNVVVTNNGELVEPVDSDGLYKFAANKLYQVTISTEGTAQNSYCILKIGGIDCYTRQIVNSSPYTFYLLFKSETDVKVTTRWGLSSQDYRTFADDGGGHYQIDTNASTPITPISADDANAIVLAAEEAEAARLAEEEAMKAEEEAAQAAQEGQDDQAGASDDNATDEGNVTGGENAVAGNEDNANVEGNEGDANVEGNEGDANVEGNEGDANVEGNEGNAADEPVDTPVNDPVDDPNATPDDDPADENDASAGA